jgi:hypothetical protein
MKGYMEDGTFSRCRDIITAEGAIVFVGNIDGDIETIVRTSNLFYPMPKEMEALFRTTKSLLETRPRMTTLILPAQGCFTDSTPLGWTVDRCPKPQ